MTTRNSIQRVLNHISIQPSTLELEVLRLVAMTGLHPQALVGLTLGDVDWQTKNITCTHKGTRMKYPMTNAALDTQITFEVDPNYRYFGPLEAAKVFSRWRALCTSAGLRNNEGLRPTINQLRSTALPLFTATLRRDPPKHEHEHEHEYEYEYDLEQEPPDSDAPPIVYGNDPDGSSC